MYNILDMKWGFIIVLAIIICLCYVMNRDTDREYMMNCDFMCNPIYGPHKTGYDKCFNECKDEAEKVIPSVLPHYDVQEMDELNEKRYIQGVQRNIDELNENGVWKRPRPQVNLIPDDIKR